MTVWLVAPRAASTSSALRVRSLSISSAAASSTFWASATAIEKARFPLMTEGTCDGVKRRILRALERRPLWIFSSGSKLEPLENLLVLRRARDGLLVRPLRFQIRVVRDFPPVAIASKLRALKSPGRRNLTDFQPRLFRLAFKRWFPLGTAPSVTGDFSG